MLPEMNAQSLIFGAYEYGADNVAGSAMTFSDASLCLQTRLYRGWTIHKQEKEPVV